MMRLAQVALTVFVLLSVGIVAMILFVLVAGLSGPNCPPPVPADWLGWCESWREV